MAHAKQTTDMTELTLTTQAPAPPLLQEKSAAPAYIHAVNETQHALLLYISPDPKPKTFVKGWSAGIGASIGAALGVGAQAGVQKLPPYLKACPVTIFSLKAGQEALIDIPEGDSGIWISVQACAPAPKEGSVDVIPQAEAWHCIYKRVNAGKKFIIKPSASATFSATAAKESLAALPPFPEASVMFSLDAQPDTEASTSGAQTHRYQVKE